MDKGKTTTALFIPSTPEGKLTEMIRKTEEEFWSEDGWKIKVLEKPGTPLMNQFLKTFEMEQGCYRGKTCVCKGTGTLCMISNVVYKGTCKWCKQHGMDLSAATYIGETARQLGTRSQEHINNARLLRLDSFIMSHWMDVHSTESSPPEFEFVILSKHKEPLSRQVTEAVFIREEGALNKRKEFSVNELIRMEGKKYSWDQEREIASEKIEENDRTNKLKNFAEVMCNVINFKNKNVLVSCKPNGLNISRKIPSKRRQNAPATDTQKSKKKKKEEWMTGTLALHSAIERGGSLTCRHRGPQLKLLETLLWSLVHHREKPETTRPMFLARLPV